MARVGRPPADTIQMSARIPTAWVARAEAIARKLARSGHGASVSSVYRAALGRGLDALEAEHRLTRKGGGSRQQ